LPRIVEHLHAHGAPLERAVAIVERATLPEQRVLAGTLRDIVERAHSAGVGAPALLIVGEIAARAARPDSAASAAGTPRLPEASEFLNWAAALVRRGRR